MRRVLCLLPILAIGCTVEIPPRSKTLTGVALPTHVGPPAGTGESKLKDIDPGQTRQAGDHLEQIARSGLFDAEYRIEEIEAACLLPVPTIGCTTDSLPWSAALTSVAPPAHVEPSVGPDTSQLSVTSDSKSRDIDSRQTRQAGSLQPGGHLEQIARLALIANDRTSVALAQLSEEQARAEVQAFERYPFFSPEAEWRDNGDATVGLSANFTLLDWGKFESRRQQAQARLDLVDAEYRIEENEAALLALQQAVEAMRQQELGRLASEAIAIHEDLLKRVKVRIAGGVAEGAEIGLVKLRLHELRTMHLRDDSSRSAALAKLRALIHQEANELLPDELAVMASSVSVADEPGDVPVLLAARARLDVSEGEIKETDANRIPIFVLSAFAQTGDHSDKGLALRLNSDTVNLLSGWAEADAARAQREGVLRQLTRAEDDIERELTLLAIELRDLETRRELLSDNVERTQESVELFHAQLKAGSRPITDAIRTYQSQLTAQRDLVDIVANNLLIKLRIAEKRGALVPPHVEPL